MSVHVHRTERVTGSEGREGANGVGGGNGDGNGDVNGDGDGAGAGTGVEANEGAQDGNEDGSGNGGGGERRSARWERGREWGRGGNDDVRGTGTGVETRERTQDGNRDGSGDRNESSSGDGNGDGVGEGGREAQKRKESHRSCRRHVGDEGDLGGKRETRRQDMVGSVATNPDNLENRKEAGGGAQGTQDSSKNCTSRVCPLCRVCSEVFVL